MHSCRYLRSGRPSGRRPSRPSIGRPISDTTALLLDDALHPVLPGEPGELCLAGSLVGRGYRNEPELTASRFVVMKSESGQPLRIYRTGDQARLLDSGEIAFLGRLDEQVKIRGYRVEVGEITASLNQHPGIEASAVVVHQVSLDNSVTDIEPTFSVNVRDARSAGGFGPDLVGYVVVAGEDTPTAADLRDFLAARLPDYMIPILFVEVAALPVAVNGKLDKSALPLPAVDNLLSAHAAEVASSQPDGVQQQLGALVASLLRRPYVGADENFFLIGGHPMLGVQLVSRIREQFGVALTLRQLFGAPTVAALSGEVGRLAKTPRLLRAYCVVKQHHRSRQGVSSMRLIDYQTVDRDADLLPGLLQAALRCCAAEGVHLLEHLGYGLPKMRSFDTFAPYRARRPCWPFYYRAADPTLDAELRKPDAWDPSEFDGDTSYM